MGVIGAGWLVVAPVSGAPCRMGTGSALLSDPRAGILGAMSFLRRAVALLVLVGLLVPSIRAGELEDVLARARRRVGLDRDLDAVQSLYYRCRIEVGGKAEAKGTLEILLQKPCRQKTIRVLGDQREIVGLDDTEAWMRVESLSRPKLSRIDILPLSQMRLLKANALENLWFYSGSERFGGRVELRGTTTFENRPAVRVAFIHSDEIVFVRTFDQADGRLLTTEGPGGEQIREQGEQSVAGLRFPERLVSTGKMPDGSPVEITILFDEIVVNGPVAADSFTLPLPGVR